MTSVRDKRDVQLYKTTLIVQHYRYSTERHVDCMTY